VIELLTTLIYAGTKQMAVFMSKIFNGWLYWFF